MISTPRALSLLVLLGLLASACATRAPVVIAPQFPDYPFPTVPDALAALPAAADHQRAWQLLQSGDLDGAATAFRDVLAGVPQFHPADAGLGYVGLARGESAMAVSDFDRALARSPSYVPALLGRGEALLAADDIEGAVTSFEAALAADPSLAELRPRVAELRFSSLMDQVGRARALAADGRDGDARVAYERVIAASPDSDFLYVELAEVERRQGDTGAAVRRLEQAIALDPNGAPAWRAMADLYLETDDLDRAEQALSRLGAIEPGVDVDRGLAEIEDRRRRAALPPEFLAIETAAPVTRGELAALIADQFSGLLATAEAERAAIITDARNYWAYGAVIAVAQAEVMDADTNYRFLPDTPVTRSLLAEVVSRLLRLGDATWTPGRASFSDLGPGHLSYAAAATAVSAGVLEPLERNSFQPAREVAGAEAIAALGRLAAVIED